MNSKKSFTAVRLGVALLGAIGLAGAAQAQSSVSMYGLIDMSVGSFQAPGGKSVKKTESGNMSTSFYGFKGSEDLGGGLSAQFVLESFMRNDTGEAGRFGGDVYFARSSWVGLSGGFGTVALGRNTTSLFVSTVVFNALGDSFGFSPTIRHYFTSGTTTGDTGWGNSVKYTSPNLGGATFTAHVAAGEGNGGRNLGLSGMYFSGPFGATFAWQKVEQGAAVADTNTWNLGASYDLGVAKLFCQYGDVDNKTTKADYKIAGVGASVGVGATGKVLAQYSRVTPDTVSAAKPRLTSLTVGYDYNLSKRTDAYAMVMRETKTAVSSATSYGVGIRHRF